MEYKSITFDMNKPIVQQITEPLNSAYGVAVKVYKDGQLVSADLSVDGTVCTEGPNGWQLAELSSGNAETMKTVDVDVTKYPTLYKEINPVGEAVNTTSRVKNIAIIVPLSAFFDSDITISPEDVKVLSVKMRNANYDAEYPDEWTDTNTQYIKPEYWMTFTGDNNEIIFCIQQEYQEDNSHSFCWYYLGTETREYGEKTIPTSYNILLFAGPIPGHKKSEYSAVIQIDTKDGFSGKFKLLVQEQDLGYFEK